MMDLRIKFIADLLIENRDGKENGTGRREKNQHEVKTLFSPQT